MILNIDLGSLYVKIGVVDENKKQLVAGEVVRISKPDGKGSLETLINSAIDNYSKQYDIKRVHLIPSPAHIKCELIEYEPVLQEKYERLMKSEINRNRKEEKRKERMGDEYEPPEEKQSKNKYEPISFKYSLVENEVFHRIEKNDLISSKIYVEYIESKYLRVLTSITSLIDKDIRIISPIRLMMSLPFPKNKRMIVNYGHRSITTVIVGIDTVGNEYIEEVLNEVVNDNIRVEVSELATKHELTTLTEDPVYRSKLEDLKELKNKHRGYELHTIGGNATYLQNDLFFRNKIEDAFKIPQIPLVLENTLLPVVFSDYNDFQYNNLTMNLKNRFINISMLSTQASRTVMDFGGDLTIALLCIVMILSYGINSEYLYYERQVKGLESQVSSYIGDGSNLGKLGQIQSKLDAAMSGKSKNYYNIAELLRTLAAPLEIESIKIEGKSVEVIAYSDNVALVRQFLETVKARQLTNDFTQFSLSESDISTVYRNGRKLDRVVFQGRIY